MLAAGFAYYMYSSNPTIKAIVDQDESKLFYYPVKKMEDMSAFAYDEIALQVEDSVTIYAYRFLPASDSLKGGIFFLHGSGGNVSRYAPMFRPLLEAGYLVYSIDWRSFGKSNGRPLHQNVLDDSKLAFAAFKKDSLLKNKPHIVYGQSVGGQVAVRLVRENEALVDALVLDGSVASFPSIAADMAPIPYLQARAENHPEDFNQPYRALDDIQHINQTPKLIIQSKDDRVVRPKRGKALFEMAKEPKTFWETEGDHIFTLKNYPQETVEALNSLLQ